MNCDNCRNQYKRRICKVCNNGSWFEEKEITNADRIRRMNDVELAKFIGSVRCNTYMIECGYPACVGMEGKNCVSKNREPDADILAWLQSTKQPIFRRNGR